MRDVRERPFTFEREVTRRADRLPRDVDVRPAEQDRVVALVERNHGVAQAPGGVENVVVPEPIVEHQPAFDAARNWIPLRGQYLEVPERDGRSVFFERFRRPVDPVLFHPHVPPAQCVCDRVAVKHLSEGLPGERFDRFGQAEAHAAIFGVVKRSRVDRKARRQRSREVVGRCIHQVTCLHGPLLRRSCSRGQG